MSQTAKGKMNEKDKKTVELSLPLEINLKIQGNILLLEYKIVNRREKPIYLFNVLWSWNKNSSYVVSPEPVYISLKHEKLVNLTKGIAPLPRWREVELRIVPFATKVNPGQQFSETLSLSLPLEEYNPYFPANEQSRYKVMTAERLVFSLQFISEMEGLKVVPSPLDGALQLQHPRLLNLVQTVQSNTIRIQVPVEKRLDEYEEF
jgi:hypothetical protein